MIKYVLMELQQWDRVLALTPAPQKIEAMEGSVGFLLVYDSLEKLQEHWADASYVMVEPRTDLPPGVYTEVNHE